MSRPSSADSVTFDDLDRQILQALQVAPRAPFARMAGVLGVSEQTVARRYQRMRTHGLVRVLGRPDPSRTPGTSSWTLRIGCRPGTAHSTADALARRTDTSWVSIGAGGAELMCQIAVADSGTGRESLLHHLPRASNVLTFTAHQMLHRFVGRGESDWVVLGRQLSPAQRDQLRADPQPAAPPTAAPASQSVTNGPRPPAQGRRQPKAGPASQADSTSQADIAGPASQADSAGSTSQADSAGSTSQADSAGSTSQAGSAGSVTSRSGSAGSAMTTKVGSSDAEIGPADRPLLTALAHDGRASYAALAAATGWTQRQVAHRLTALTSSGAIYLDVDTAAGAIGFRALASLWFTVAPADLESVGARLADHAELAFAGAVTGSANLMASAVCRDAQALYRYVTTKVAAIPEVRTLEIVPVLTRVKQAYFLVENGLLRDPPP